MNIILLATIVALGLEPRQPKFSLFASDVCAAAKYGVPRIMIVPDSGNLHHADRIADLLDGLADLGSFTEAVTAFLKEQGS